ncbi:MAG TPA: nuclear transport factor 2 family protein [Longimicrobiales bacterium]|nr:nuclear transport factor 2 family protein [Longimicrobiales bacterium]
MMTMTYRRSHRRRAGELGILACLAVVAPQGAVAQDGSDVDAVVAVVDAFHAALAAGDSTSAVGLLAEDVVILESGGVEDKAHYRSGHLAGDMRFAQAVPRQRGEITVDLHGDVAWAHSTSVVEGTMGDRDINSQSAELMVLVKDGGRWMIHAIHWSSRPRRGSG